jgi:hypothetical protein
VTATQESPVPTIPEPITVTALADVPTTTEGGTDVLPKSAPPWHKELSVCNTHTFRLAYDRDRPAILVEDGDEVIAWAGLSRRDVSDECRDVPRKPASSVSSEQPQGIYASLELRCGAPGRIEIDARPIEYHGSLYGSIVVVGLVGSNDWLVSAIVVRDIEGRRVYVNEKYCTRS